MRAILLVLLFATTLATGQPARQPDEDRVDQTAVVRARIAAAAAAGGGTVKLPAGTIWVSVDQRGVALDVPDGVFLDLTGVELRLIENDRIGYHMIHFTGGTRGSGLTGGKIIGDRERHLGAAGEWGMCVSIRGAAIVTIKNTEISNCWGDGIYVGASDTETLSREIVIDGVQSINNRRNNISLVAVDGFRVSNVRLHRANGIDPQAGIDLEPNRGGRVVNGVLSNVEATANAGRGVVLGAGKGEISNIRMERIRTSRNAQDGLWIQQATDIEVTDISANDNGANGVALVSVSAARLVRVSTKRNKAPFFFRNSHVHFK